MLHCLLSNQQHNYVFLWFSVHCPEEKPGTTFPKVLFSAYFQVGAYLKETWDLGKVKTEKAIILLGNLLADEWADIIYDATLSWASWESLTSVRQTEIVFPDLHIPRCVSLQFLYWDSSYLNTQSGNFFPDWFVTKYMYIYRCIGNSRGKNQCKTFEVRGSWERKSKNK